MPLANMPCPPLCPSIDPQVEPPDIQALKKQRQDERKPYAVSPQMFGAIGDGNYDDTNAITDTYFWWANSIDLIWFPVGSRYKVAGVVHSFPDGKFIFPSYQCPIGNLNEFLAPWAPVQVMPDSWNPGWIQLNSNNTSIFATTAPSDHEITMNTDMTNQIKPGMGVKVLDRIGVIYGDGGGLLGADQSAITGLSPVLLDNIGRLYVKAISDGAGYYHIEIYNRSSMAAASLVGHTATYNSTGQKAIVSDNVSLLGGTIDVAATGSDSSIMIEFYKWYLIESVASNLLTLRGPPLSTGAGHITQLWYGDMVEEISIKVDGAFALVGSGAVLETVMKMHDGLVNRGQAVRIAYFEAEADVVSASTKTKVNVVIAGVPICTSNTNTGLELTAAGTAYRTVVDMNTPLLRWAYGSILEIAATQGDTSGTVDKDCRFVVMAVKE